MDTGVQLGRRFRALKLWLSLRYHGIEKFRKAIRLNLDQAQGLAAAVRNCPVLELMAPVELSAVCFRHHLAMNATEDERNRFNITLLKRTQQRGHIYLSNAVIRGSLCLRACIVNHRTTAADIDAVVPEVLAAARECLE